MDLALIELVDELGTAPALRNDGDMREEMKQEVETSREVEGRRT